MSDPETTSKIDETDVTPAADVAGEAQPVGTEALPDAATEATGDTLFDLLWAKVLSNWDDDKAHGSALEYAITSERLPDLAGRYRALKDVPARADRAQKRLDAIVLAATQMMMSMRTPASTKVPLPITLSVAGLFACAAGLVAYYLLYRH